jgi:hypothetical protein
LVFVDVCDGFSRSVVRIGSVLDQFAGHYMLST